MDIDLDSKKVINKLMLITLINWLNGWHLEALKNIVDEILIKC